MVISQFSKWAYFGIALNIIAIPLFCYITFNASATFNEKTPIVIEALFLLFFWFIPVWLTFGESRTKIIKFWIFESYLIKRGFCGLGSKKQYNISEITGYRISFVSSKTGVYEYLYLLIGNIKVVKISEFYHTNYKDLKNELVQKDIQNLGIEKSSFLKDFKEMFQFV